MNKLLKAFKVHGLNISMIIGAVCAILTSSFASFAEECEQVSENVLRLHIIAESDSEADQHFKIQLRDYILETFSPQLAGYDSVEAARAGCIELLPVIEAAANEFAIHNSQFITAEVTDMYFTTRVYENVTMPAGNYSALRLVIGEGGGENWWCVMFPPLCLPAVTRSEPASEIYYTPAMASNLESGKTEVKFAVFEWLSKRFK